MTSPVDRMRAALHPTDLDGWLIYDFQNLNPHARRVLEMPGGAFLTRRFFVYVPRGGQAVLLHNHIEGGTWANLSAGWGVERRAFGSHDQLNKIGRAHV